MRARTAKDERGQEQTTGRFWLNLWATTACKVRFETRPVPALCFQAISLQIFSENPPRLSRFFGKWLDLLWREYQ
ncbi:hypothetical protein APED_31680 [Acanthopleuribacter pedis]